LPSWGSIPLLLLSCLYNILTLIRLSIRFVFRTNKKACEEWPTFLVSCHSPRVCAHARTLSHGGLIWGGLVPAGAPGCTYKFCRYNAVNARARSMLSSTPYRTSTHPSTRCADFRQCNLRRGSRASMHFGESILVQMHWCKCVLERKQMTRNFGQVPQIQPHPVLFCKGLAAMCTSELANL
jgi:hypothetical protein